MTQNERDIDLLHRDPHALLLAYQETIKIIVKKYIEGGMFRASDFEDIVQEINAGLIPKIPSMQAQYNGMSLFRTYFSVIVRNICLRMRRTQEREIDISDIVEEKEGDTRGQNEIENLYLIEDLRRRFMQVLRLYGKQTGKLKFCLKVYHRIPIRNQDILDWLPHISSNDREILLDRFRAGYESMSDSEVYGIVSPIMNREENKANSVDALRKWTDSKIEEIIEILNGEPKRSAHTKETLKILVEDYYSPFLGEK